MYFLFGVVFVVLMIGFFVLAQQSFFYTYRDEVLFRFTENFNRGWEITKEWTKEHVYPQETLRAGESQ